MVAILEWANGGGMGDMDGDASKAANVAVALLLCQKNSHPFQNRTLLLHQPVKVGRSVAKWKADVNNAIFDCKVLSRHHASIWYDSGHFYLADTQSSNGTFVNNRRLSEGGKESVPYEVSSGDLVQFGVDVVENSGSITHGCIVAILKLYLPDGKEAIVSPKLHLNITPYDDLHTLSKIIKEAIEREYILEEKLKTLCQAVESCRTATESSWRAQVCQDHLLCRVNFLEKRLAAINHTAPRTELQQILEEKYKYEVSAKESLRKAQEEKLKLMNQICSLQWSLRSSEDECYALRNNKELTQIEFQELSNKFTALDQQLKTSQKSLTSAEKRLLAEKQCFNEIISDYENQIIQLKYDNEKQLVAEASQIMDSDQSNIIIDNKNWEKGDYNDSSLSESLRGLPDYMKAILPDNILSKVGCKSLRSSAHIKELEQKLCNLKLELEKCQLENKSEDVNENSAHSILGKLINDGDVSKMESKIMEEIIKQNKHLEDHFAENPDKVSEDTMPVFSDEEERPSEDAKEDEVISKACENSNSNEKCVENSSDKISQLLSEIKDVSEQIEQAREDNPIEKMIFLQEQLSAVQNKIAALKEEQKILHSKLVHAKDENLLLTAEKELMSSTRLQWENELAEKTEKCKNLELRLAHWVERENSEECEISKYVDLATDLKKQLSMALESEANSCREIKELNDKVCELQRQLDSSPRISDLENLKAQVELLEIQLASRDKNEEELQKQVSILTDIQVALEEKLCNLTLKEISEQSSTDSSPSSEESTELTDRTQVSTSECIVISSSLSAADLIWNRDQGKFYTKEGSEISSISVDLKRLTDLEEELVTTKERWANVSKDRAQLANELENLNSKYNNLSNRSNMNMLIYIVPLAAVFLYVFLMHQSIS